MSTTQDKTQLLDDMRKGYAAFSALLASLSSEQMTTPEVNSNWSVKDNIAHLTVWQQRVINMLPAIREQRDLPDPTPAMTEEEINAMYYQQFKSQPLDQVVQTFHATSRQLIAEVEATSIEDLTKPIAWLDERPVWGYIAGNSYEHFQEHSTIIHSWLAHTNV